jgi:hypothetical protein
MSQAALIEIALSDLHGPEARIDAQDTHQLFGSVPAKNTDGHPHSELILLPGSSFIVRRLPTHCRIATSQYARLDAVRPHGATCSTRRSDISASHDQPNTALGLHQVVWRQLVEQAAREVRGAAQSSQRV